MKLSEYVRERRKLANQTIHAIQGKKPYAKFVSSMDELLATAIHEHLFAENPSMKQRFLVEVLILMSPDENVKLEALLKNQHFCTEWMVKHHG